MSEKRMVVEHAIKRRPGYLYFIDAAGNIWEAKLERGGRKRKKKDDETKTI